MATHGEIRRPPVGTFDGRLRGDSHGRRHEHLVVVCSGFLRDKPAAGSSSDTGFRRFLPPRAVSAQYGRHRWRATGRREAPPLQRALLVTETWPLHEGTLET
jgi:hypothetical protein